MSAMQRLVAALRDPASVAALTGGDWSALISVARAEVLLGTLAHRLEGQAIPVAVAAEFAAVRAAAKQAQVHALWEAEMCRRALSPLGVTPILLKGTAYAAARLRNAAGRQIGDLDILVPRARLDEVEAALMDAGWEWVKDDPYDQSYYRRWMHELPPLIHKHRDRMIDVHHSILPLTARPRPDMAAMLADAQPLGDSPGLAILSAEDMVLHCVAHLLADGALDGGLRNLWDFHCLLSAMDDGSGADQWRHLRDRAALHGLTEQLDRTARIAHELFATPLPATPLRWHRQDKWYRARLLARDDWGRETRLLIRLIFYIRSHLLRMPLPLLLRHLWVKWRRGQS